jgi:hypothetical protein
MELISGLQVHRIPFVEENRLQDMPNLRVTPMFTQHVRRILLNPISRHENSKVVRRQSVCNRLYTEDPSGLSDIPGTGIIQQRKSDD